VDEGVDFAWAVPTSERLPGREDSSVLTRVVEELGVRLPDPTASWETEDDDKKLSAVGVSSG